MEEKETKKTPKKTTTKKSTTTKKATATKAAAAKKTTTTKKTTASKTTAAKKTTTAKKATTTKAATTKKATTAKKTTAAKKTTTKKTTAPKKTVAKQPVIEKVEEKEIVEPIIEREITQEELLERTIIIDGLTKANLDEVVNNLETDNIVLKNKVIKRSKFKRISIIILSILIAAVIIATSIYAIYTETNKNKVESSVNSNILDKVKSQQDKIDSKKEDEEQQELEEEYYANIKNMTLKELEEKVLAGEELNIMIFSSTCLACAQFEVTMQPVLEELNVYVYKLDVVKMTSSDREALNGYFSFEKTPTLYTIREGKITNELVGNKTEEDFKTWAEENLK